MSGMKLGAIAKSYMAIWNSGNQEKLDEVADENLIVSYTHFEKPIEGFENYKKILKQTYSYFPDIRINLNEIIVQEHANTVTILWNYEGTHKNGDLFGKTATGKKVKVEGITILEISEGKVKMEKGIVDSMSLMMQITN